MSKTLKATFAGLSALALLAGIVVVKAQTFDTETTTDGQQNQNQGGGGTTIVPVPVRTGMDLGDLIIYDQLFNSTNPIGDVRVRNFGDLVILSELFGGGGYSLGTGGGLGYGSLGSGGRDIGDLYLLDRLFASQPGQPGIFSGQRGNLGDLIILDNLFR